MLSEMMQLDQEAGLYDVESLPDQPVEQPSNTPQEQPEPESLDIVTPEIENVENTVENTEKSLTKEEKRRIEKQERAKQLYTGAISVNNESKSY
jgi:hypothetical protein